MSHQKYVAMEEEEGGLKDDGQTVTQGDEGAETATLSQRNTFKNDASRDIRVRSTKRSASSIPVIRRRNNILARNLSIVELFGGLVLLVMFATRWILLRTSYMCTWYTGLWGGIFLIANGALGCATSYILRRGYFMAWMTLSFILTLQCATIFTLHTFEIFLELNRNTQVDTGLKGTSKVVWNSVMVVVAFLMIIVSVITIALSLKVVCSCHTPERRPSEEEQATEEGGDIQLMPQH